MFLTRSGDGMGAACHRTLRYFSIWMGVALRSCWGSRFVCPNTFESKRPVMELLLVWVFLACFLASPPPQLHCKAAHTSANWLFCKLAFLRFHFLSKRSNHTSQMFQFCAALARESKLQAMGHVWCCLWTFRSILKLEFWRIFLERPQMGGYFDVMVPRPGDILALWHLCGVILRRVSPLAPRGGMCIPETAPMRCLIYTRQQGPCRPKTMRLIPNGHLAHQMAPHTWDGPK